MMNLENNDSGANFMLRLYITRHGQTEWNLAGKMQGWADSPLTAKGREDAKLLSKHLIDVKFEAIYSSPSKRAYDTADIVKGMRPIEIKTDDRLKEMNIGSWEGQTKDVLKEKYSVQYTALWETPHLFVPIDGESLYDVQKRMSHFLEHVQKQYQSGNIFIVTHTCALKLILEFIKGTTMDKLWTPPRIENTSLSIVEIDDNGKMTITLEGDMSHLAK